MQEQLNDLTQFEKFAVLLEDLRPEVTTKDRKAAKKHFSLTPETISRYLNGRVNNIDTAVNLLTFFKGRIAEREKMLA